MRHVEHCMGTVFTIVVQDAGDWSEAVSDVVTWLYRVDGLFSTYQPYSDISRLRRGEVLLEHTDALVVEVLGLCGDYERTTEGYFTAHLPDGLDPSGLVKGWAIERASAMLRERGSNHHAVNGGGDVQTAGESGPGRPWRIGISDPFDTGRVLKVVTGRDLAVATSGVAERGAHIVNPRDGGPARDLVSLTVVGTSLTEVDVLATAGFAMGKAGPGWLAGRAGHVVVDADGRVSHAGV